MKCPKCNEELFKKTTELDCILPAGEWSLKANISYIISSLLFKFPNTNIELSEKEFSMFMAEFNYEVMTSIILDKRLIKKRGMGLNEIFNEGFDFRGIKIRVR